MDKNLKIGQKVYIQGVLPLKLSELVNFNTPYTVVSINYYESFPITIDVNNIYISLPLDCVKPID